MKKLLFLDVDGVLNCSTTKDFIKHADGSPSMSPSGRPWDGVDADKIEKIKRIVEETGASIVITSTWREDPIALAYLKRRFGEEFCKNIIGETPIFRDDDRAGEINAWLGDNIKGHYTMVVLDDCYEDILCEFGSSYIQTLAICGITDQVVDKCIQILGKK